MAEVDAKASPAGGKPPKPPNPVWRMMGLPNIRWRLPSRNWMIFLSVTGSWTAMVFYDRREKKRIQQRWSKVVEHISKEKLDERQMPRKLTVYLSAPPADGIVFARDHFNEYVKPILVAAALDWDAVEGRREGDVRAGLADRIRKLRARRGEPVAEVSEDVDVQDLIAETRLRSGVREWDGFGGDIVIGRHTWKEYIRGMHEGWLGPMNPPPPPVAEVEQVTLPSTPETIAAPTLESTSPSTTDDGSPVAAPETPKVDDVEAAKKKEEEEKKAKKKVQRQPFISTAQYHEAQVSPNCPAALGPSTAVPLPHLLGFFNFPIRMYRFLNRRKVADQVGRQTVAAVLGVYAPFDASADMDSDGNDGSAWEQQKLLAHEEPDWHKSVRERKEDDDRERVWLDDIVIDARIGQRMRKFQLDADAEDRAKNVSLESKPSWLASLWPKKEEKKAWEKCSEEVD